MARNKYPEITRNRILDTSMALFLEKGYEHTTIQDILDALGDLSKGAIYHHFKSKEEILDAASDRIWNHSGGTILDITERKDLTGAQKIAELNRFSLGNSSQNEFVVLLPDLLDNPKLLAMQMRSSMYDLAPNILAPLIREGQADGSIKTDYPDELAQILALICNTWINPIVFPCGEEELNRRFQLFHQLTSCWGFSFLDDQSLEQLQTFRRLYEKK